MTASQPCKPWSSPVPEITSAGTISTCADAWRLGSAGLRTRALTVCPQEISRVSRWLPTKPVAPVRKVFIPEFYMQKTKIRHGGHGGTEKNKIGYSVLGA